MKAEKSYHYCTALVFPTEICFLQYNLYYKLSPPCSKYVLAAVCICNCHLDTCSQIHCKQLAGFYVTMDNAALLIMYISIIRV